LGGLAGVGLVAVAAIAWRVAHRQGGIGDAAGQVLAIGLWASPLFLMAAAGGAIGFLATGVAIRNRLVLLLSTIVLRFMALVLASLIGLAIGVAAFVLWWMWGNPGEGLAAALAHAGGAARNPADAMQLFAAGGLLIGLVVGLFVVGKGALRVGIRLAGGGLIAALGGLVMYCIAYVLVYFRGIPPGRTLLTAIAQAVYSFTPIEVLFVSLAACVGMLLSNYSWRLHGILTFVSLLFVVLGYALYTLTQTLPAVPREDFLLSGFLFAAELASLLMVLLYSFYTIDVSARKEWRRATSEAAFSTFYLPKVALQVPTYNEPPELVEATLRSLLALDYPPERFVIMVGDDSTDPACSEPLRAFCEAHGIVYHHRPSRSGYKAGALNALLAITPSDANLIAVVDADYQVEPGFLCETVGYFVDPGLGWLQTPQDYRNRHQSFLTEQYYLADAYFYRTILPSRNEENSIIFCGTMGMLRRRAVEEVGGWGEKYITEDAELSARLLTAGWRSLYVNKTYGRGLIPPTFDGYKRQHYRWAFGGGRILRGHGLRLLFGRFTFRQRLDYLVGTLNWFEGAFIFAIAVFVLALGISDLLGVPVLTHHSNEVLLVGLVPLFLLLDGLTRVHLVLRRSVQLTFGGTLRILGMWFSVKFSNMRAALKGFVGFSLPFVRTPKAPTERPSRLTSWRIALRLTRFETGMALLLLVTAAGVATRAAAAGPAIDEATQAVMVGRWFLCFWLLYYTLVFTAAPLYAYKSFWSLGDDGAGEITASNPNKNATPEREDALLEFGSQESIQGEAGA
jgi:cellulose synthase/poly-beta-1,6-N-acetylglucosamine synthase-like glycosyltransferase